MHLPPEENWQSDHSSLDSREIAESDREGYFDAMIEAMDTQIGRLLGSMDADVRDDTHDSISFMPVLADADAPSPRDWLYADLFFGDFAGVETADFAMRNERYKLLRFDGEEEFYDLQNDPYEYENLLSGDLTTAERVQYETLQEQITELRSSE